MEIDPKIGVWVNAIAVILGLLAGGTLYLGHLSPETSADIKGYAGDGVTILAALNLIFHLYSAPVAGPLVK